MIDAEATLTAYLLQQAGLTALVGQNLWAATDPPKSYPGPAVSPALVFVARGGGVDYSDAILARSFQFRAIGQTEAAARQLDQALYTALHGGKSYEIKHAEMQQAGNLLIDPDTDWPFVLSAYTVLFSNT